MRGKLWKDIEGRWHHACFRVIERVVANPVGGQSIPTGSVLHDGGAIADAKRSKRSCFLILGRLSIAF